MGETVGRVSADQLKSQIRDDREIAILDAREEWTFSERHLFTSVCLPLSRVELLADQLVPRRSARVVWCDGGEGLAEEAAERMASFGYTDVSVLDGGIDAWEKAGYRLYSGVHVPSKAFAEVVEHQAGTPYVTAEELKKMMDDGSRMIIYDSRSFEEYNNNSIPGAISVPGAELVYRFTDLTPSPDTTVIVNCGGRTRSIIGAQSLINAGFKNRIMSLKDGTMAWHLAGYGVVSGAVRRPPNVSDRGYQAAQRGAGAVAELCGIRRIGMAELDAWRAEAADHTLYVVDVRTPEEYETGHLPGAKSAPGGQLIQETDYHLAVWGARVVVVDNNGIRATMTASWLKQMGWDPVAVLATDDLGDDAPEMEKGPYKAKVYRYQDIRFKAIDPAALKKRLDRETAVVVDFEYSKQYRKGHIPGAFFSTRARLRTALEELPDADAIVFTSPDGLLAGLAAAEAGEWAPAPVLVLSGGTAAWVEAGYDLEAGEGAAIDEMDDCWLSARELGANREEAMREYLAWEIDLVNQMETEDDHRFQVVSP